MSTPQSWSRGSGRQADKVGWSQKVMEMGQGADKDEKGKKGGHTMTESKVDPHNVIGCQWVFAIKKKADGDIEHYKAWIVTKGFSQIYVIDYNKTFAPVIKFKWSSIWILLTSAT